MKKAENSRIEYDAVFAAAADDDNDYDTMIVMIMMMINSRQL